MMKCSFINNSVVLDGQSILGFGTNLEIEPCNQDGIWWQTPNGDTVLIRDTILGVHRLFHYLTFRWKKYTLRIPEHLFGLLYAMRLNGICIIPYKSRLPYDSTAGMFWDRLKLSIIPGRTPDLYTPNTKVEVLSGPGKFIAFYPDVYAQSLTYEVGVAYPNGVSTISGDLDKIDVFNLAWSRSYGRTWAHKCLSKLFGREHKYVWFESNEDKPTIDKKLKEIATHRLLDMLGVFPHICPPGGRLVGKIVAKPFMGHVADVSLVQKIKEVGLKKIKPVLV